MKTKTYTKKTFKEIDDIGITKPICNLDLVSCHFESCELANDDHPPRRTLIRNVRLTDCTGESCNVCGAELDDVCVSSFRHKGGPLRLLGLVYRHVILEGSHDRVVIRPDSRSGDTQLAWNTLNKKFYERRDVDWSLDISKGEFKECDIRGIPARLVRRDPETQIVVTKSTINSPKWTKLNFHDGIPEIVRSNMITLDLDDEVVVAPKRSPAEFKAYLANFELLRKAGLALPQ